MLRFFTIAAIAALSYFAVGYGAGQWSWALYIGGAVLGFGILLEGVTFIMRPREKKTVTQKVSMPVVPQEEPEKIAARIDERRRETRESEQLRVSFSKFLSDTIAPPVTELQKLISLVHQGAYGKLSPAAEEALQQAFDKTADITRALETYERMQPGVTQEPVSTPASIPVSAPVSVTPVPAQNPGIRSLKISSDDN